MGSPFAFKEAIYAKHVPSWTYPPLAQELAANGAVSVYSDQGAAGASTRKTVEWKVTGSMIDAERAHLGTLKQTRHDPSAPSLVGGESGDYSKSDASKRYSSELSRRLAKVLLAADRTTAAPHLAPGAAASEGAADEPTAAQARPRRLASDVSYDKDGRLVTAVVNVVGADNASDDFVCPIAQRAVTTSVGRAAYSLGPGHLHGQAFEAAALDAEVVCVCAPTFDLESMELVFKTATFVMSTVAGPVPIALDTNFAADWHTPLNYRDYLRSPQRSMWRTAMELKYDQYRALNMFTLESESEVRAAGHKIMDTLWAFKIKFDQNGKFEKLNPRWCVVGTNMDRDIYESYSDVVRWTTVLILAAIRACYPVHDFQFDVSDAFQATRTDEDPSDSPKPLYYRQGPGFEVYGANGEKLVCRALTAHQGRKIGRAHV